MRYVLLLVFLITGLLGYGQVTSPDLMFSDYKSLSINSTDLLNQSNSRSNGKVYITLDRWNLELNHTNLFSEDYKFIDQNGKELTKKEERPIPMEGYTSSGGRTSITIADGFIYGYIEDEGELFYIEPARYYSNTRNKDEFIIYNTKDIRKTAPMKCGMEVEAEKNIKPTEKESGSRAGLCYDVEYAIVNDWSMFNKYGAAGLEARNIGITNNVISNYDDEFADGINFVITGQYNSTCSSCNPFIVSTDLGSTLDNFTAWGNNELGDSGNSFYIKHDVASLWSDVFADSGTVGLAWLNAICENIRYNVLSDLSTNANTLRVLTAHELGHNFGAGHDDSGSGFLMAPSVNNTNTWSPLSISAINGHISSRPCLEICAELPATIYFNSADGAVQEGDGSGVGGSCQEGYREYSIPVAITKSPSANVVISVNTNGSSATNSFDYQLMTNSLTFVPSGALSQDVLVRVYNDVIVENPESLLLNLVLASGPGQVSSANTLTITINSEDAIETNQSGGGDTVFYGNSSQSLATSGFFEGARSDVRSRFLLRASDLQALNISAGEINMMAFYVYIKESSGIYNNFRIGMLETTANSLSGTFLNTTTVFSGNIQTSLAWNYFDFTTPFIWDGTSNIYVDMCYDNSTGIGNDQIVIFNTLGSGEEMCSWSLNTLDNCGFVSNYSLYFDRAPVLLLKQNGSTDAETLVNSEDNGRIKTGETANLFSDNGKIIASIKNTGSVNLQCIDATIESAGNGKQNLPSGGEYTDKTFHIETGSNGTYELTLYYTDEEIAIWGGENLSLDFVKSTVSLANSNSSNTAIIATENVNDEIGSDNVIAYTVLSSGSGYFALSNASLETAAFVNVTSTFDDADVIIEELGSGMLLRDLNGEQYLVSVNSTGELTSTLANDLEAVSYLPTGDLCILGPARSLMIRRNSSSYAKINVDTGGGIALTNTSALPSQRISQEEGHFGLLQNGAGIIFQNSVNQCYKIFINSTGGLSLSLINCP